MNVVVTPRYAQTPTLHAAISHARRLQFISRLTKNNRTNLYRGEQRLPYLSCCFCACSMYNVRDIFTFSLPIHDLLFTLHEDQTILLYIISLRAKTTLLILQLYA